MTDALDDLVALCLARVEDEGLAALDELCREHPAHAAALRARVTALAESGLLHDEHATPARLGDFRLGRRLGGGGMGVVHAAVQESLGREVALKIVRADQLYFPGSRERFRREGQLVARLSHAAIVPVHLVGEEGGVPFLAMELLRGATLAEALAALGRPPRDGADLADAVARVVEARDGARVPVAGPLYDDDSGGRGGFDAVLRVARAVASALEHAHARGVLHRDLKASNVMLTVDGRALLFDFGLARPLDAQGLTQSGARVGSLPCMAPEQVRGDAVDERTDVYGLGALLCEALTLRPPHEGPPDSVAAAILRGDPVPLRARRRDLPADVAAILAVALDPDPARRYASAAALLRDIDCALARRPVSARPAGAGRRILRWSQRHPARAALLALVVVVPAAFALQQAAAARAEAAEALRAEANLDRALQALGPLMAVLDAGVLDQVPHLDAARVDLLEDALAALLPLLEQRPDDVHLACRAVRLQAGLGSALAALGRTDAAELHLRAALALGGRADVPPAETLGAWNGLGALLERRGRFEEACEAFAAASARLPAPDGFAALATKSTLERNLSRLHARQQQTELAARSADAAVALAERALAAAHDEYERFEGRLALGAALMRRAVLHVGSARAPRPGAIDDPAQGHAFAEALPLLLALVEERPQHGEAAHEAISACLDAPAFLPPVEAETVLRQGLSLADRLLRDRPERLDYARSAAALANALGLLLVNGPRLGEARQWFERSLAASEGPLLQAPDDYAALVAAGRAGVNLASVLVQLERRAEAAAPAALAGERLARASALAPGLGGALAFDRAWAAVQQGYGRLARGELPAARRLGEDLAGAASTDPVLAVASGEILAGCAAAESDAGIADLLARQALDRLELGLQLGFTGLDYLTQAPEWAELRDTPRFRELLDRAARVP